MLTRHSLRFAGPNSRYSTLLLLTLFSLASGCSSATRDPTQATSDDGRNESAELQPKTYGEAVTAIVDMNETIRQAFAASDVDGAHAPLHTIGHILDDVAELAEKAEMTDEQRQSVKAAVETLFDEFGSVDATMHGAEGKTYDEASTQIDASLAVLNDARNAKIQEGSTHE